MAADNLTRIVLSAVDQTAAAFASVNKGLGTLQTAAGALSPLLGGLTGALSAGAFVGFVKGTIDAADGLNDLSQRIGVGIRDLAAWKLAADQNGTSLEAVGKAVKSLSTYMVEHREKLREAGITATDANGALVQLADLFAAMPDGIEKTALATQLMGKAGLEMIPVLNRGSAGLAEARAKAEDYGKKLAELAPQADEFNDMMSELGLQAKVAGMNITGYFLPGLIGLSKWLNDVASGGEKAKTALDWMDQKLPLGFGLRWAPTLALAGVGSDPSKRSSGGRIGGAAPGMSLADELALGDRNLAGLRAMGLLDKGGKAKAAKAGKAEIFGPFLPEDIAAAMKAEAAAIEAANKAIFDHTQKLSADTVAAEYALETYGLTEAQIADLELARLKHARAIAAENGAQEAALKYYDEEIASLERIRTAKFAVEARDTAKKEAEDAAKAWQDFSRDIEHSLTDALMRSFEAGDSFGEAFANNLKNIFKTMLLKAAVQITVGTVSGAAQQALGINLGGSGGGSLGSLLSSGTSLYNAATGGGIFGSISSFGAGAASAASELALGAAFVGPSASLAGGAVGAGATAGLATGSASAASGLAGLASAAPWIGGAIAVASILGGMFGDEEAPIEWGLSSTINPHKGYWGKYGVASPFGTITAIGQHLDNEDQSPESIRDRVAKPLAALDEVLARSMKTDEIERVGKAIRGSSGEYSWNDASIQTVMMKRLNKISNAIGGWVDELFDTTTGKVQERYQALAQILAVRGDTEMERLAQDMFNALGKWNGARFNELATGVEQFNSMFRTDAERIEKYSAMMRAEFEKLNLAFPETLDGFKALVDGIDTSTKAGFELYATLIDLAPTMASYYDALKAERDIKAQLAGMGANKFATAVDLRRYQGVAANYDPMFAADYAYNISTGAIRPGGAANGDLIGEIRALRDENRAHAVAQAGAQQETARILRRWNGDGMPAERVVA